MFNLAQENFIAGKLNALSSVDYVEKMLDVLKKSSFISSTELNSIKGQSTKMRIMMLD